MPPKATGRQSDRLSGEVPRPLVILLIVIIVGVVGAGAYYAYNGGWATQAQLDNKFKHEIGPIMAAKRGNTEALDKENELRKQNGQPLLQLPKDRHETAAERRAKLEAARREVESGGRAPAPSSP